MSITHTNPFIPIPDGLLNADLSPPGHGLNSAGPAKEEINQTSLQ